VPLDQQKGDDSSFFTLAKYIGVIGKPQNEGEKPMAMTAPVIMEPKKLTMTAPVVSTMESMSFVLPFEYTDFSELPKPTDPRVILKEIPKRIIAVKKFSGWFSNEVGLQQLKLLVEALKKDDILDEIELPEETKWSVAQYHPPFTLPFLRRNEIWIDLDPKEKEKIRKFLETIDTKKS
jgi:hypothetical protein